MKISRQIIKEVINLRYSVKIVLENLAKLRNNDLTLDRDRFIYKKTFKIITWKLDE